MQRDESRQGVFVTAKFNLTVAKNILAASRDNLIAVVNLKIKWRYEEPEHTHYNEKTYSMQQKYLVLICWSTKP